MIAVLAWMQQGISLMQEGMATICRVEEEMEEAHIAEIIIAISLKDLKKNLKFLVLLTKFESINFI